MSLLPVCAHVLEGDRYSDRRSQEFDRLECIKLKNLDIFASRDFYYGTFSMVSRSVLISVSCGSLKPVLLDRVSIMGSFRDSRSQELAQLQLQLASASRLLDAIEKRALDRRTSGASESPRLSNSASENTEMRFAACVAFGMSKARPGK
jgi:hypothetical protein